MALYKVLVGSVVLISARVGAYLVDCPGTTRDCPPSQFGQAYVGCSVSCYDESVFSYGVTYCEYEGGGQCYRGLCYGSVPDGTECDVTQTAVPSPPSPTAVPTQAPPPTSCPPTFNGEDYVAYGANCYDESVYAYGIEVCFYDNNVECHNGLCYGSPYPYNPPCNPVPTPSPMVVVPTPPPPPSPPNNCNIFRASCQEDSDCCSGKCGRRNKCRK